MTLHDLYLLSPELAMAGLAMLLLLLDLVVRHKGSLVAVGLLGLAVPLALSIALWLGLDDGGSVDNLDITPFIGLLTAADSTAVPSNRGASGDWERVSVDRRSGFGTVGFSLPGGLYGSRYHRPGPYESPGDLSP